MTYIALAIDKMLNYNSRMSVWMSTREVVANTFNRHDFAFCWSHAEMAPTITGLGYDWAVEQTGKALAELIELSGGNQEATLWENTAAGGAVEVMLGPAQSLPLENASVDCIVMDPPYHDNVMYAELADFFYVWLKRTAGLLYPDEFSAYLTDKENEAVANVARFKGCPNPAEAARLDYQEKMEQIFTNCRRILKADGVMTVMFTHKEANAWDALATSLVKAGFVITASWPVNTEAEGSLHIKDKAAAKSTIFIVCRPREAPLTDADPTYWEDIEPKVAEAVRQRIGEFQKAGIAGIDLFLASFGPALQVFSEAWPLTRGRPLVQPTTKKRRKKGVVEAFDPHAVRPEDALDAARREVIRWRMEQLATIKRQHHLDPLTEWYILAWDAFKAPKFPANEALKLAQVIGLDFDTQVKNVVCEVKAGDVILWDSEVRRRKGRLGSLGGPVALDTLHRAAHLGRSVETGVAKVALDEAGLLDDATLMTALEALLNVLPPPAATRGKKGDGVLDGAAGDFDALNNLRRLAFADSIPEPLVQRTLPLETVSS